MTTIIKQKTIEHPLEDVFDIEQGTTMVEYKEVVPAEIVESPRYDEKDDEIEFKLEEIYTSAMSQAETLTDQIDRVEGKYKARMGEVSATMLTVALGAVREKSALKMHKDKLAPSSHPSTTNTTNNLNLIADRNEILRLLGKQKDSQER